MLRLLQIEFQKIWLNRTSKILLLISFVFPLSILILSSIKINFFGFILDLSETKIFEFPYIWHITTFFVAFFKFFFAIVVVSMIGNEYSNRTLKQNLIDGLSKKEVILSKFYFILAYSLVVTLFVFIITLLIGIFNSPSGSLYIDTIFDGSEFILAYFTKLLTFFSLCLFVGVLIKRSAFALGFLFVSFVLELILYGLFRFEWFDYDKSNEIMQFFPFTSMWNLIDEPFSRIASLHTTEKFPITDYPAYWYEFVIAAVWIFIYIFLSYRLLKRRDL
ncbi:ABC transporter permease subunit [Kordia sp. YSTF-M3]|uniref:ABC transporter permease subunit n=1 Tax=Kordia aestuariivivens TaxID=2759037 RepID=A0ABR7Q547_9FLAO|nr:ABC transporter permease subunit [Kordia aestuariivivens]MBC8753677.1 ABC transporter permease subunit [Kordia aestuariivivens]